MSGDKIIVTTGFAQGQTLIKIIEEHERGIQISNARSLIDSIIETTANLKGKQLSARALRRAEARMLKPKHN